MAHIQNEIIDSLKDNPVKLDTFQKKFFGFKRSQIKHVSQAKTLCHKS